jgi:hypothetical protein
MKSVLLKSYFYIAILILLIACAGHSLAKEQTQIIDVSYDDVFTAINSFNLTSGEVKVIIVFNDDSVFFSTGMFRVFFEFLQNKFIEESDLNVTEIIVLGAIEDEGREDWVGKWTISDGYRYYPLT